MIRRFRPFLFLLCLVCGAGQIACGQKGPPLAPIVLLPRAVTALAAKRVEDDVVLQFTLPTVNTDSSGPADLRRIEVYGHTGPLPAPADFLKYGTLVASVDVRDPRQQTEATGATGATGAEGAKVDVAGTTAPPKPVEDEEPHAVEQGATISVKEVLTEKQLEIGPMPPARVPPPPPATATPIVVERLETPGTVNFELPPQRYYVVVGVSRSRGRRGPYAGPLQVALAKPLAPPEKVDVAYTAAAISLTWPPSAQDQTLPVAAPATTKPAPPPITEIQDQETPGTREIYADVETEGTQERWAGAVAAAPGKPAPPARPRYGYNVYDASASASASAPAEPAELRRDKPAASASAPGGATADKPNAPVVPLNASLLTTPTFSDPRVEFGTERCYVVRRVEMWGAVAVESPPSAPACVTPVDTFPPAAPKGLVHIANAGGVSLLWEANTDADLGGYVVLRGEAPGDTLSPLTPAPIAETSFTDTTVRRGRTYVYEVVAVDKAAPPNQSEPSNRVEETIR